MRPEEQCAGDWREARRQRALELADAGWKGIRIAEALGVNKGAVSQWLSRREEQGADAFKTKPRTGRPPKLTSEQLEMIPSMLSQGAEVWGFREQLWTGTRVAAILCAGAQSGGGCLGPPQVHRTPKRLLLLPQKAPLALGPRHDASAHQTRQNPLLLRRCRPFARIV